MQLSQVDIKRLVYTAVALLLVASMYIGDKFDLPATKAVAVLFAILSPFSYGVGYWFAQRWFTRIGIALMIVAVIAWFMPSDMFAMPLGR
ncbi:hypothetical protein [Pseudomonas syringae]|uniref:hypothetical protein n=1 Tax=Pseudomonas syringae TaxID=317 RepID=UPI00036895CB|nr:hypothetical protein [Pseudomonas syringae]MDU8540429.1 hypothetical protein [Pseudomonas syringae pv. actinidiae]